MGNAEWDACPSGIVKPVYWGPLPENERAQSYCQHAAAPVVLLQAYYDAHNKLKAMRLLHSSCPLQQQVLQPKCRIPCCRRLRNVTCATQEIKTVDYAAFPTEYDQAIRQAQTATKCAIADGHKILEIDFPVGSLFGVQGDGEGQTEMNASMKYLRQLLNAFRDEASSTRIFFPDNRELAVAISGQTMDPAAGRAALDPKFADTKFKLGYLTKQNVAWALFGMNFDSWSPAELVKDTDKLFVVAYPSFNPKEELKATFELYEKKARAAGIPLIIFNGELDRIRGGYYPGLFYPSIEKISKEFLPQITTSYYIHNFKGSRPGALFRCYPGPWQVMRRNPLDPADMRVIWTGDKQPSLKEVSLDILASNRM